MFRRIWFAARWFAPRWFAEKHGLAPVDVLELTLRVDHRLAFTSRVVTDLQLTVRV